MGYYTNFKLEIGDVSGIVAWDCCPHQKPKGAKYCPECGAKVDDPPSLEDSIIQWMHDHAHDGYDMAEIIEVESDQMKWYDWQKDLAALSAAFPSVRFTLHGTGERRGDIWRAYALGGKLQVEKAVLTFVPFNPKQLKEVPIKTKH